jgi:hypothetical protein
MVFAIVFHQDVSGFTAFDVLHVSKAVWTGSNLAVKHVFRYEQRVTTRGALCTSEFA